MSQIKYWFRLLLLPVLLCFGQQTKAQSDPVLIQALDGASGNFKVDSFVTVQDSKWWDHTERAKIDTTLPRQIRNVVTLKFNEESRTYIRSNFTADVNVRIFYTNKDSLTDSTDYHFIINYDTTGGAKYNSKRLFTINNAYKLTTKILGITTTFPVGVTAWNVIPLLRLENEMEIDRYYNLSCASFPSSFYSYVSGSDPGQLWVFYAIDGATLYDFEWTFIDSIALRDTSLYGNFDNPDPVRLFEAGTSRVTISDEMYKIPLLFDNSGYVFSRVRAVKILPDGQRIEGKWSSQKTPTPSFNRYYFTGHERKLNWQATTSFAEEGKRKSVVEYYDGASKARQIVTKDNSTQYIIVGETFYDYQGRPAIQVLPAPTLSNLIGYVHNFNKALSGDEYDKSLYDSLVDYCSGGAPVMNSTTGANWYFSNNNGYAAQLNIHKALPKAFGYAFAETRYSQDNTGRISMQGNVGEEYQIGSGHETRYFYGKPDQKELDALFGTEAGDANHYQKNMVRDANGQYSVSYVDMEGRTVATALAGKPANVKLDALESYNVQAITKNLADPAAAVINGMSMSSTNGLLVTKAGTNVFHYTLQPDSLRLMACDSSQICYDCVYNLEISISDECNNSQLPDGVKYVLLDSNFTIGHFDTICGNAIPGFDTTFSIFLLEGSYTISKKLTVSRAGYEYYRDSIFLQKNLCKTFQDFYNEALIAVQNQECEPSCASCLAQLGTYESFRDTFLVKNGIPDDQLSQYESQIQIAYNTAKANCDVLCDSVGAVDITREMMLADMMPSSGQYANPDPTQVGYDHNIFHQSSSGLYNFQNIGSGYYVDENGKRDSIYNNLGHLVPPNDPSITEQEFIAQFKPSWAEALLPLHPEYCHLQASEALRLSDIWDQDFRNTDTYEEAKAKGYLNPVELTGYGFLPAVSGGTDPLSTLNSTLYAQLQDKVEHYRHVSSTYYNIWGIATATAHCNSGEQSCFETYLSLDNAFDSTLLCRGELDMAWRSFQQLYLTEKKRIIDSHIKETCPFLVPQPYYPRFPDLEATITDLTTVTVGDSTTVAGVAVDSLSSHYHANCVAYVQSWWHQLATCNFSQEDSLRIIPRLVGICDEGSDASHALGSSSVNPGSTLTYKSFDELIKHYTDSAGITYNENCNGFLITAPRPYEHPATYASLPLWTKPDSCQCSIITEKHHEFLISGGADAGFAAYLLRTMNITMSESDVQQLLDMCNNGTTCKFLEKPIKIPAAFQCGASPACLGCDSLNALNGRFHDRFDVTVQYDDNDSLQAIRNRLYANYMNYYTGFNKPYTEYLQFLDSCGSYDSTGVCDTLKQLVKDFRQFYYFTPYNTPGYNADGCDTTTLNISNCYSYTNHFLRYRDFFADGVMHIPDSIYSHLTTGEWDDSSKLKVFNVGLGQVCNLNNKFTWEIRLKYKPFGATTVANGVLLLVNSADPSNSVDYHLYHDYDGQVSLGGDLSDPSPQLRVKFDDWKVVTIKVEDNKVKLYIDGVFHYEQSYSGTINGVQSLGITFNFCEGYVDYERVYDGDGRVVLDEEFSNACDAFAVVNPLNDCNKLPCDSAFKNYFNTHRGTSYTYAQIQAQYVTHCGREAMPCQPYDDEPTLCTDGDLFPDITIADQGPCSDSSSLAFQIATEKYNAYKDSLTAAFENLYLGKCMKAYQYENFTVTDSVSEFHYTLYAYDRAGNLVKTVPPQGVDISKFGWLDDWSDSVALAKTNDEVLAPNHKLITNYRYNTLNQVVAQNSPDGGTSEFWYDRLGRLVLSRNAKQKAVDESIDSARTDYSYTKYDILGRIIEVGEINNHSAQRIGDTFTRDADSLDAWHSDNQSYRRQITSTYYDNPYPGFAGLCDPLVAQNLRSRVAYTTITHGNNPALYDQASFYSYDIHGNVDTLLQDYRVGAMAQCTQRFKKIVYGYDLISGKVNYVAYQPGKNDQFYHRYTYDAENRLTVAETSTQGELSAALGVEGGDWERDASYQYLWHGSLARTVLGQQKVQGVDYGYTLQGWLKVINGVAKPYNDIGLDGYVNVSGVAQNLDIDVAQDAYGVGLYYHAGDYAPCYGAAMVPDPGPYLDTLLHSLYNGNIAAMSVIIPKLPSPVTVSGAVTPTHFYNYRYDQLNRIKGMDMYVGYNNTGQNWDLLKTYASANYKERVSYDGNGNILKYLRNGSTLNSSPLAMDSLHYNYYAGTNQLRQVRDSVNDANYAEDIDNESDTSNYVYDPIGNLIYDHKENIDSIKWNVYGKITDIYKHSGTKINYTYDAGGNRISKTVSGSDTTTTWYTRDATGNVLSVYRLKQDTVAQDELHLYGSSRLGILKPERFLTLDQQYGDTSGTISLLGTWHGSVLTRGKKFFELTNHLGNVLVTVTDRKQQVPKNDSVINYFEPDVATANDYYPFGMQMPGREYIQPNSSYRYGFNGKELDEEVTSTTTYDYGFRIYNPALGRFLSVDPLTKKYPHYTPYQFAGNSPILNIDVDGLEDARTQPNTEPLNPDERFKEIYEGYKNAASVFRKAVEYYPPLKVVQAAAIAINLFAEYKIAKYINEESSAKKDYEKLKASYDNRNLDNEAYLYFAKKAGIYDPNLSDETNVHNFVMNDKFKLYVREQAVLYNQLENEKVSQLAKLIKKANNAADQKSKWEAIQAVVEQLTPFADTKNDIETVADILTEKDKDKRMEKIIDFITEKLRDKLSEKGEKTEKDNIRKGVKKILNDNK